MDWVYTINDSMFVPYKVTSLTIHMRLKFDHISDLAGYIYMVQLQTGLWKAMEMCHGRTYIL